MLVVKIKQKSDDAALGNLGSDLSCLSDKKKLMSEIQAMSTKEMKKQTGDKGKYRHVNGGFIKQYKQRNSQNPDKLYEKWQQSVQSPDKDHKEKTTYVHGNPSAFF